MENQSDRELIVDYLKGDEKSLGILFSRYLRPVYAFICRWVGNSCNAEDITQEVFVKVWQNLKKPLLGFSKGFDPQEGNFRTWIFSIARNACIDFLRRKKEIPFSGFEDEEGNNSIANTFIDPALLPSEVAQKLDTARMLSLAMEKLPADYRLVLYLRYNDHFTFREIGEILGQSLNTVKSRHRRALAMLREAFKNQ